MSDQSVEIVEEVGGASFTSPHFSTVALNGAVNARRTDLPERLRTPGAFVESSGQQVIRGIPFLFAEADSANVVLLDQEAVSIDLGGAHATYVLFVHAVEDEDGIGRLRG